MPEKKQSRRRAYYLVITSVVLFGLANSLSSWSAIGHKARHRAVVTSIASLGDAGLNSVGSADLHTAADSAGKTEAAVPSGELDVIIPSATVSCVLKEVIAGLQKYVQPSVRQVYVIVPARAMPQCLELLGESAECVDEYDIIPLGLDEVRTVLYAKGERWNKMMPAGRAAWYYQQLLKLLAFTKLDLSNDFLVWDADNILIVPYRPYIGDLIRINIGGGRGTPYAKTELALIGVSTQRKDLITHQMLVRKDFMLQMMTEICGQHVLDAARCGKTLLKNIPSGVDPNLGFSEYNLYHAWTFKHRSKSLKLATKKNHYRTNKLSGEDACGAMQRALAEARTRKGIDMVVIELNRA